MTHPLYVLNVMRMDLIKTIVRFCEIGSAVVVTVEILAPGRPQGTVVYIKVLLGSLFPKVWIVCQRMSKLLFVLQYRQSIN